MLQRLKALAFSGPLGLSHDVPLPDGAKSS